MLPPRSLTRFNLFQQTVILLHNRQAAQSCFLVCIGEVVPKQLLLYLAGTEKLPGVTTMERDFCPFPPNKSAGAARGLLQSAPAFHTSPEFKILAGGPPSHLSSSPCSTLILPLPQRQKHHPAFTYSSPSSSIYFSCWCWT